MFGFDFRNEQVQARFAFPTRDCEFGSRAVEFLNVLVAEQTNERALGATFDVFSSFRVGETRSRSEFEPSGTGSFSTNAKPLSLRIWRSSGMVIVIACFVMNGKVRNKPSWFNR